MGKTERSQIRRMDRLRARLAEARASITDGIALTPKLESLIEDSINGTGASQYGRFGASAKARFIVKWAKTDDEIVEMIKDLLDF